MKYKLKINLLQTAFIAAYWIIYNFRMIPYGGKISDYTVLSQSLMNTGGGYNSSLWAVGLVMTIIFSIAHNYSFSASSMAIVKYGRGKYILNDIKQTVINALLFALEYCGVNAVFTIMICEQELLVSSKYFLLTLLYFITRFSYFLVLGSLLLLMYYIFKFKRVYMIIAVLIMLAINSLPYLMIEKGFIMFADYVNDWMLESTFDLFEYSKNTLICIISSAILITGTRLVFLKKDILIYEEES